jgi:uncharacterized OB-fold protein
MSDRPLAQPDDDLVAAFWEHCAREELRFQRCSACGTWRHPPRVRCARCGAAAFTWERSSGRGRVYSWTVTHQSPIRAFAERAPFAVLVVELEEGVRMVAGFVEGDVRALRLDLPVEVTFERVTPDAALPQFRPRSGPADR